MARLSNSIRLALGLAFPAASSAMGLGDIHLESRLYQPLAAQIDLLGVTDEDAAKVSAAIADDESFQRYGLERPSILSATEVAVGKDQQGRPVLLVHSSERLTEPVVTLLVDVHSPAGEVIREYTLLLDPPGLASRPGALEVAPPMPLPIAVPTSSVVAPAEAAALSPDSQAVAATYAVAPHDTLVRIAGIAGAHSAAERRRMMIAIYRANPSAFQANLNLLRGGVTLRLPSAEELAAILPDDAEREYAAQMAAWRASAHRRAPAASARVTAAPPATVALPAIVKVNAKPDTESGETERQILAQRVDALEASLKKLRQDLAQARATPPATSVTAASVPAPATSAHEPGRAAPALRPKRFLPLAVGFGLVLAALAWLQGRRRKVRGTSPPGAMAEDEAIQPSREKAAHHESSRPTMIVVPDVEMLGDTVEQTFAFYNPESTINTTHVVMSGGLSQPAPYAERRKNPADVLRQAIEREPHRTDLRLKLLELYYIAVAENRRAFLETVRQLPKNERLASPEDWSRIADMGRVIAAEDELFSATMEDKAVA